MKSRNRAPLGIILGAPHLRPTVIARPRYVDHLETRELREAVPLLPQ